MTKPAYNVLIGHEDELLFKSWTTFLKAWLSKRFDLKVKQVARLTELMEEIGAQEYDLHVLFLDHILVPSTESLEDIRTKILDCVAMIKANHKAPVIVCSAFDDSVLKEQVGFAGADYFFSAPVAFEDVKPALERCLKLSGKAAITSGSEEILPLAGTDQMHLNAAEGWLGLGNHLEANAELENVTAAFRSHPAVLELRWHIYAKAKKWDACVDVASAVVKMAPDLVNGWIHRSFALHALKRTQEASDLLLAAADRFPKAWLVRYNLACYACQLGNNEEAWDWLEEAFDLGECNQVKIMALDDPDLEQFWAEISEI
jgi:tetratricopeptide (TPR) repeat protein